MPFHVYVALQQKQYAREMPWIVTSHLEMTPMAYARTADEPRKFVANTRRPGNRRGFFRRAFDSMVKARRRSTERQIAEVLRGRGETLTDDAERQIDRILSSSERF
jgi:hypothetical protein